MSESRTIVVTIIGAAVGFGLNHPQQVTELRRDVERSILATYGLPPVFASHAAPGQALRESWRIAVALSVQPVAELVQAQLREALAEPSLRLNMRAVSRCRHGDTGAGGRLAGGKRRNASGRGARGRRAVTTWGRCSSCSTEDVLRDGLCLDCQRAGK